MLTKNFYYALGGYIRRVGGKSYTTGGVVDADGTLIGEVSCGSTTKPTNMLGIIGYPRTDYYKAYEGVFFGTGTTPPTPDDYVMEAPILGNDVISIASAGEAGVYLTVDDTCLRISSTYDVTNLTDRELVISEVGLFGNFTANEPVLFDHTVLDAPIIISANQTIPVNYEIRFPFAA